MPVHSLADPEYAAWAREEKLAQRRQRAYEAPASKTLCCRNCGAYWESQSSGDTICPGCGYSWFDPRGTTSVAAPPGEDRQGQFKFEDRVSRMVDEALKEGD